MWNIRSLLTSELDDFGRVENEKNRLGLTQNYFYDDEGKLKTQTNFDSAISTIIYSSNRIVRTVRYEDCSENCFVYDVVGNITEAQNAYGKTVYRYDSGARLVYQKDITTGEEVYFTYDDTGNRTKLLSSNRETSYTYGKNNEVKEIFDNKQRLSVQLDYDKNGREVLSKFGNGTSETTLYDKAGRTIVKAQNSERGELLWGEGYLYGEDGKRAATVDNAGRVTLYEYNNKGQLATVYYPYTQEMINLLKSEAEENGLPTLTELGENRFLPSDIKTGLTPLMNFMQNGLAYSLTNLQIFIKENYGYDRNGNRTSKTTNYGTIEYNYDRENRLLSSGSKGQAFVYFSYDSMGNLLTEDSALKSTKYAYNSQNRLIYCEVSDKSKKEYSQTNYAYDAFGRRVIVQDKGEAVLRTLYDGLTFNVIKQSPTFENGLFTDSQNTGIRWNNNGKPTGERYRYIGDEERQDNNRYIYLDENSYKSTTSRYYGERTQINVNGTLAAQSTTEGTQYFTTDLFGSVSTVSDAYGYQLDSYTYDAFGSLVQGSLTGTTDFGYLGKQSDPTSRLYNYGYRDYKPQTARFTTVDPIRDGNNWFAYVNNDPVNHFDILGLCEGSDKSANPNIILSGLSNIDYGANYDQIMKDIYGKDLSNGISADFLETHNFQSRFENMVFNKDNPLNQLVLDKALGLKTDSKSTKSCQTTAVLNAWAVNTENGITGKNILNVLNKNSDGTFGEGGFVDTDGSLLSIWGLGYYMGKELGTTQYITSCDEKIIPPNILVNMSVGAIVGLQRNESGNDDHYVYRDWSITIDSMDHTRSTASEYTDYNCRPLYWAEY